MTDKSPKTTPEGGPLDSLIASPPRPGVNAIEAHLANRHISLARENYLRFAYPDRAPDPIPAEFEMALPEKIQYWPAESESLEPPTPEA